MWLGNLQSLAGDSQSQTHKLLLNVDRTAYAEWSPDGRYFYIQDNAGSNLALTYIYKTENLKKLDAESLIFATDPEAKKLQAGHIYFNADRWMDNEHLLIRYTGHTDEAPVTCFDLRYQVSPTGDVKKLSQCTGPAGAVWCQS
jgi:hypothetical protein